MLVVLGIDPGSTESGYCISQEDYTIVESAKISNDDMIKKIISAKELFKDLTVVIESIQSYGMTMGKSLIETCYFIGRLIQVCSDSKIPLYMYPRPVYGKALCGAKVKDPLIRSALEMRFGSYDKGKAEKRLKSGVIKQEYVPPGPLYMLQGSSDQRSAYAVLIYHLDLLKPEERNKAK